jgi:large subunit ribosomal protein L21
VRADPPLPLAPPAPHGHPCPPPRRRTTRRGTGRRTERGKQYRVEPGQEVTVERLAGEVGDEVSLTPVLVVDGEDVTAGGDLADRAVSATITAHDRGEKIRVFTYKNKSRQRKTRGHRQHRTTIRIDSI